MTDEALTYTTEGTVHARPVGEPSPKEALDSFTRLDEAARSSEYAGRSPTVSGCPTPYLDVHVHDAQGMRIRDVPVTLDFPEGGGQSKKTDYQGLAHFPNVDVDASTLVVQVHRDWPDDQPEPTYRATVVAKTAESGEQSGETKADEEEPMLYLHPWQPFGDNDDDDGDDDEPLPTLSIARA